MINYTPTGVCSKNITINLKDNIIEDISFTSGCPGNLQGICSLVKGMRAEDVIEKLKGIKCGSKNTSCPDQLSKALEQYVSQIK